MSTSHLDDELLSAHLDGDDLGDGAAHLAECDDCRRRLDGFRAAVAAVRADVPTASAERREAAVAAALAARVVPLQARRRQRTLAVLGAAAAVLTLLGAMAVLRSSNDGPDADATSAALDESGETPTFEGGDLGDQSDEAELALRLRAAVEPQEVAGDAASAAPTDEEAEAVPEAGTTPNALVARSATRRSGVEAASADPDCTKTVAATYDTGLGPLSYRASVRWKGTPAVVLVYPVEGATGPLDHRVLVMARGSCQLLVAQTI